VGSVSDLQTLLWPRRLSLSSAAHRNVTYRVAVPGSLTFGAAICACIIGKMESHRGPVSLKLRIKIFGSSLATSPCLGIAAF